MSPVISTQRPLAPVAERDRHDPLVVLDRLRPKLTSGAQVLGERLTQGHRLDRRVLALGHRVPPGRDGAEQLRCLAAGLFGGERAEAPDGDPPLLAVHPALQHEGLDAARRDPHTEALELAVPVEGVALGRGRQALHDRLLKLHRVLPCKHCVSTLGQSASNSVGRSIG